MRTADVAIVGGGVIGCSIAWALTQRGLTDVVLFERGRLAGGATGICPGGIRQQFAGEADCILARESLRFFERINEILEPDAPFVLERSGYLFLAESPARLDQFRRNVAMQNRLGIPAEILSPDTLARLLPALRLDGILGGAFCAEDGFLEDCHGVTHAFARRAREGGLRIQYEDVLSLRRAGERWVLTTATGSLEAAHVVLAAGADSVALAATAGLTLPVRAERRRLAYTVPAPERLMLPLVVALDRGFAGKQLLHGVFYLGWLRETPADDDLTFIERALEAGATLLPLLGELAVRRVLSGVYDTTPDHRPILGSPAGVEGLHLAVGFSGHGFMIAPAVAQCVAGEIEGRPADLPMEAFTLQRFAEGRQDERLVI